MPRILKCVHEMQGLAGGRHAWKLVYSVEDQTVVTYASFADPGRDLGMEHLQGNSQAGSRISVVLRAVVCKLLQSRMNAAVPA